MTFRILKKDLKSRPVTNIILLLFITLSVMCAAAGVNNVMTVLTAQEDYFDRSGMADCMAIFVAGAEDLTVENALEDSKYVSSFEVERSLGLMKDSFHTEKGEDAEYYNGILVTPLSESSMTYFDEENRVIAPLQPGEIYVPKKLADKELFRVGETFTLSFGETELTLTVAGTAKDALLGSEYMGTARVLISAEDYDILASDALAEQNALKIFSIDTENETETMALLASLPITSTFTVTRTTMGAVNYLNLAIAGILVLLSACLIVVFLTILRYTVRFTLSQEMREIGIMKAVGLQNREVERIYLIKYFFMALLGAVMGFAGSIPFGKLMLKTLAETMVIEGKNIWSVNLICTVVVTGLVMLFCRRSMKKQRRISPVDAVRSGSEGEDGGRKHRFSLAKSKMRPWIYLPLKHIFSGMRQYLVMGLACTICLLLILVVVDTTNTMDSAGVYSMLGLQPCDAVWTAEEFPEQWRDQFPEDFYENGQLRELAQWEKVLDVFREDLEDMGIRAHVFMDTCCVINLRRGDLKTSSQTFYGLNISADEYDYLSGTAPTGEHEIALTPAVADSLDAGVGDTVWVSVGAEEQEFLVTGLFQTMMNIGYSARVSTGEFLQQSGGVGNMGIQIKFEEGLSAREKNRQIEVLKESFPEKFYTPTEYLYTLIGNISGILKTVRNVLAPLMLAICAFVMVLMESSFIDREKGEIALMKAVGFRNSFIWGVHLRRTAVTAIVSMALAELLALPVAQSTTGIAFRSLGAVRVDFCVKPAEVYLIWPAAILLAALAAVGITALTANRITARDTANIE